MKHGDLNHSYVKLPEGSTSGEKTMTTVNDDPGILVG